MNFATPVPLPSPTAAAQGATTVFGLFAPDDPLLPIIFNIGRALIILLVALLLAGAAKGWTVRLLTRGKRINLNVASLVGNLVQIAIMALGIINVLIAFGIDLASLVTVLGVAGLAISLSLQDLLRNVVAGIYVLLEQPFRIGDRITVKEVTGVVQAIELRTSILRTDDGLQVVVPNNIMLNEIVTNRSISNRQKAVVRVRVNTTDLGDLEKMGTDIRSTLTGIEGVAGEPAPMVVMEGIHSGTARLKVEIWLPSGQKAGVTSRVVDALRARWPEANMAVQD